MNTRWSDTRLGWRVSVIVLPSVPSCAHLALRLLIVLPALLSLHIPYAAGQSSGASDVQVESAYLYNFGKFVDFPVTRTAKDAFEICILGKDSFGGVLEATVRGETMNGKKVTTRRLSVVEQSQGCSILFVSSSEENDLSSILTAADRLNLLTVSDMQDFAKRGGVIGLIRQQDRRFEVNLRAAKRNHLVLSSELLKVATRVVQ